MDALLILGGLLLLLTALARKGGDSEKTKAELKEFVALKLDEIAGEKVVTGWKTEDELIGAYLAALNEAEAFVTEQIPGEVDDAAIGFVMDKLNKPREHYLRIHADDLKAFGAIIALGHGELKAGVVFAIITPQSITKEVVIAFHNAQAKSDVPFKIFDMSGRQHLNAMGAGKYIAFAFVMKVGETEILNNFSRSCLNVGNLAASYWRAHNCIVEPCALVVTKESVVARVDP